MRKQVHVTGNGRGLCHSLDFYYLQFSTFMSCAHKTLLTSSSSHASTAGYTQLAYPQRVAATTPSGRVAKSKDNTTEGDSFKFPPPLILPQDDLAIDPTYPPQSFRSWKLGKDRNELTNDRNIIYVVAPPRCNADAAFIQTWTKHSSSSLNSSDQDIPMPRTEDIKDYLAAFYHGVNVKLLSPTELHFAQWEETQKKHGKKSKTSPSFIALNTSTESVRIRARSTLSGIYSHQLNLNDLLDAAISILPEDAYALLLLVEHDLYEDDDDEFVCGRAYGGSRVAVVSSARYHPNLDAAQGVDREHAWPASHCQAYVELCCKKPAPMRQKIITSTDSDITLLHAAVQAINSLPKFDSLPPSSLTLQHLFLNRICRTAAHELGHCFGIDHCVYYACSMQGSASLSEDARQPPYLCPVDLAKVLAATNSSEKERYEALLAFCERLGEGHLFRAFGAWINARTAELQSIAR